MKTKTILSICIGTILLLSIVYAGVTLTRPDIKKDLTTGEKEKIFDYFNAKEYAITEDNRIGNCINIKAEMGNLTENIQLTCDFEKDKQVWDMKQGCKCSEPTLEICKECKPENIFNMTLNEMVDKKITEILRASIASKEQQIDTDKTGGLEGTIVTFEDKA